MIRPAADDDIAVVARIWNDAWHDGHDGLVPESLVRERGPEQFVVRAAQRVSDTWVGEIDGVVKGFVSVAGDELEELFVIRAARGTGLADALITRGTQAIREAGYRRAWLAMVTGNARAAAFYTRQGWRDLGRIDYRAQTLDGTIVVDCHRYEIDLDDPGQRRQG